MMRIMQSPRSRALMALVVLASIGVLLAAPVPTSQTVQYQSGDETVSAIDLTTRKVIATMHVGKHPQAVAVDPTHNRVYVANVHSNSITVIDSTKNTVIGTHDAGRSPYALAVDPVAGHVYAANYGEQPVTDIDVSHIATQK